MLTKKRSRVPLSRPLTALPIRQGLVVETSPPLSRTTHGNAPADVPDEATELASNCCSHFVVMNAAGSQPAKAGTQSNLRFPRDPHEVLRLSLEPRLQRFANPSGKSVVPGRFDQYPSNMRISGFSQPAAVLCWPA